MLFHALLRVAQALGDYSFDIGPSLGYRAGQFSSVLMDIPLSLRESRTAGPARNSQRERHAKESPLRHRASPVPRQATNISAAA